MKRLFYLLSTLIFVIPLGAVNIIITINAQTRTFAVSSDDVLAVKALRASRVDEDGKCPALQRDGTKHNCSTEIDYLVWKIKQLVNHAKKNFPKGQDATDQAAIKVLKDKIEGRKVE